MKKPLVFLLLTAMLSLLSTYSNATGKNEALPFVRIMQDPVHSAMGGAGLASASSIAYASFTNAANIPFSPDSFDAGVSWQSWQPSSTSFINAGGAYNFSGKFGLAAGFTYGINEPYRIFDDNGIEAGEFSPSDIQANIGIGWKFVKNISVGINVKYLGSTLAASHRYEAVASDIFFRAGFGNFSATAGVRSLGSSVKSSSGSSFSLPASAAVGLGYGSVFSNRHEISALLDADYYFSGSISAAAGLSYTFNDLISIRAGYRYGGKSVLPSYASAGVGIKLFGIKLDAAYLISSGDSPVKNTFNIGLGFEF